jgi:predicted dehydrogenase
MYRIKIAQIGTSEYSHGCEVFERLKNDTKNFELVGYAFPEKEDEKFFDFISAFDNVPRMTVEEILNNPEIEAVSIETEEIYLAKYALMAAKANKHIHLEKPGAMSLNDFEELISIMKKTGKVLHMGYMYRYNPYISKLIETIDRGELGEIISVEAQMSCIYDDKQRKWLNTFPNGGMLFFLGCHLIDFVYRIQGTPKNVIPFIKNTRIGNISAPDYGLVVMEYDRGVSFIKTTAVERGGFLRRQLIVTGSKKTVQIQPLEVHSGEGYPLMYVEKQECDSEIWGEEGKRARSNVFHRYDSMMSSFAAYVCGEIKNPYTLEYELELYKLITSCCNINQNGK